jgi:hypothetical protein
MPVSGPWTVWSGSHGSSTPWQTSTAGSSTAWSPGIKPPAQAQDSELAGKTFPPRVKWREISKRKIGGKFFYLRMRNVSDFKIWRETSGLSRKGKPSYKEDNEVICTSYYSALKPVEGGEISISLGTEKVQWRSNFDFLRKCF